MLITGTVSRYIVLINILVWISAPAFAYASGDKFHQPEDLATLIDGRNIFLAIEAVDLDELTEVDPESFENFLAHHVVEPSPDDQTHVHSMVDDCCGAGGLVCDFGIPPGTAFVSMPPSHPPQDPNAALDLSSVGVPPLYHPPKS